VSIRDLEVFDTPCHRYPPALRTGKGRTGNIGGAKGAEDINIILT